MPPYFKKAPFIHSHSSCLHWFWCFLIGWLFFAWLFDGEGFAGHSVVIFLVLLLDGSYTVSWTRSQHKDMDSSWSSRGRNFTVDGLHAWMIVPKSFKLASVSHITNVITVITDHKYQCGSWRERQSEILETWTLTALLISTNSWQQIASTGWGTWTNCVMCSCDLNLTGWSLPAGPSEASIWPLRSVQGKAC